MTFPRQNTGTLIAIGPYRHARPGRLATLLYRQPDLAPIDLPAVESQELADSLPARPLPSTLTPGKGTHLALARPDLADIVDLHPRLLVCCVCGEPAKRQHGTPVTNARPVHLCGTCPAPGLRVVGPGGAA